MLTYKPCTHARHRQMEETATENDDITKTMVLMQKLS